MPLRPRAGHPRIRRRDAAPRFRDPQRRRHVGGRAV